MQPAGSYVVQTDEELLPTFLHPATRRMATWLVVPSSSLGAGATEFARIDPAELEAALAKDASDDWDPDTEAEIDKLLAGQVMRHAVRSAGLTLCEFKGQLRGLAVRLRRARNAGSAVDPIDLKENQ